MEKEISQEAIERFNINHLQEIKTVCDMTLFSIMEGLNNGHIKDSMEETTVWEIADDITKNAIGIMEAFSGKRISDNEYYILEGVVHDRAFDYLKKHGVVLV